MTEKKISFGFTKLKKPTLLPGANVNKKEEIELIQCLEGQTIKIIGEQVKPEEKLIIPLLNNTKTSAALAALQTLKETLEGTEDTLKENKIAEVNAEEPKTLEQRAAFEIINGLKETCEQLTTDSKLSLPIKADELPLNGAAEANLDDYERIPINQFGLAMLRGMGWNEPSESEKKANIDLGPALRPKGMGLGADKMIKPKPLLIAPAKDEVLAFRKSASVRILLGKHKDMYGQIESMDDHAGRILIKLALGNTQEWFSEFMVQPVSKQEYAQYAKVINSAKYEEYKRRQAERDTVKMENQEKMSNSSRKQTNSPAPKSNTHYSSSDHESDYHTNKKPPTRRSRSSDRNHDHYPPNATSSKASNYCSPSSIKQENQKQRNSRHNYSSDNDSDCDRKRSSHKKSKSRRQRSRSRSHNKKLSDYDDNDDKHHHKKKTKKSKRQRSRSRTRR